MTFLLTGCVRTREYKVARYEPGGEPLTQTIGRDGWYKVKWKTRDEYEGVDHTARYLAAGTVVGFETTDDGLVVARVDNDRVVVGPKQRKATYCCWYQKYKEPTQFAIEVGEALAGAGEVVQVVAIGGLVVGGATVLLLSNDDDCDRHEHKRHRAR